MKSFKAPAFVLLLSLLFYLPSCKKKTELSNQELIAGKWKINEIRLNTFSEGILVKDSLLTANPQPENYAEFSTGESFTYCFNKPIADSGTYKFITNDSLYTSLGNELYKWKVLLLTSEILNVQNTRPYTPLPGATLITYQTFVR